MRGSGNLPTRRRLRRLRRDLGMCVAAPRRAGTSPRAPAGMCEYRSGPSFQYSSSPTFQRSISYFPAGVCRSRNAQNEPNFVPPQAADGRNCAKRSQTWEDWGMWAKAVVVWGVARPGSETCKTNPICPWPPACSGPNRAKRTQFDRGWAAPGPRSGGGWGGDAGGGKDPRGYFLAAGD
jgi:hypothetical protein